MVNEHHLDRAAVCRRYNSRDQHDMKLTATLTVIIS